jgi:hypothetical protein
MYVATAPACAPARSDCSAATKSAHSARRTVAAGTSRLRLSSYGPVRASKKRFASVQSARAWASRPAAYAARAPPAYPTWTPTITSRATDPSATGRSQCSRVAGRGRRTATAHASAAVATAHVAARIRHSHGELDASLAKATTTISATMTMQAVARSRHRR